jgi:Sec-independent protein translocase protein TatA
MDILGVGPLELLFVLVIAILVIGPEDMGKTARSIGRFLNRMYKSEEWKAITQASRTLRTLPNRLAREAELEELDEIRASLAETSKEIQDKGKELRDSIDQVPAMIDPGQTGLTQEGLDAWVSHQKKAEEKDQKSDDAQSAVETDNAEADPPQNEPS